MVGTGGNLRNLFSKIIETNEGFRANCPRCEDTKMKLYVNESKGVGCCFHVDCAWYKDRGGVTANRLRGWFGREVFYEPEVIELSKEADVKFPKSFRLLKDLDSGLRENIFAYLESRGLTRKILGRMRVGYCDSGRFWGYIVFPVFNQDGEVVYWQARRFKDREPKFYNPESSRKSELIYRVGTARRPKTLVLVESIINALTLDTGYGPTARIIVALLGKSLSDKQLEKILIYEHWIKEIVIALDSDAWKEAVEIAAKLYSYKIVPVVRVARIPDGEDINSVGREKAWELIERAEPYSETRRIGLAEGGRGD